MGTHRLSCALGVMGFLWVMFGHEIKRVRSAIVVEEEFGHSAIHDVTLQRTIQTSWTWDIGDEVCGVYVEPSQSC